MLPDNFPSSMSSRNSNNPNGLRPRQQQHRRQNSTPTAFRPANIQKLPNNRQNAAHGHRRGLSLDVRQLTAQAVGQDFMVSTHTNSTGLAKHSQHLLREAQQQRIQARPGSQNPYISLAPSGSEQNLISPLTTPQLQADQFDQSCFGANTFSFAAYGGGDVNMMMQRAQPVYGDQIAGGRDFDLQGLNTDSALSTPTFASFQESPTAQGWTSEGDTTSTRRSTRRISNGIMDRVSKFETLGYEGLERPITPPNQNASNYFPPTPLETPQTRLVKIEPRPSRFVEGYDESMEETIKPSRGRVNRRAQNIFQDIRQENEQPQISILPEAQSFDGLPPSTPDYMSLTQFNQEFMKLENGVSDSQHMNNRDFKYGHRATSSFDSTMSNMTNLDSAFDEEFDGTDLESITSQQLNSGAHTPAGNMSPRRHLHSHRRNQSTASLVSNASIASLNIDSTRQATGVTPQDIDKYIQMPLGAQDGDKDGPATDNAHKYKCLYPGCKNIYYGRKENIKSHIQTHLNDRQYKCPNCPKCFVRQHDLKRHAKIHTGVKPYHCDCGNGFARHDALTRHRQRGMCIGALENLPERKKNKRGRPRKNPHAGESTGTSSPEGPSDSSAAATPVLAATPAFDFNNPDHVMERNANILMMNMPIQSTAPMTAAPTSPMFIGSQSSPLLMPAQSYVSPEEIMSSHPTTPRDAHQATSPPDLVHSTSPALSGFDLDNSATMPDLSGLPSGSMDNMNLTMPVNVDNPDEAMMFAFIEDYSVHEQYVDNTPKFNDGGIDDILSDNPFY